MSRRRPEAAPLAVVYRPLASLLPYAQNARTHTPEQIQRIAASIKNFGWTNPVLIGADSTIIAGHARVLAAGELGFDPVPCIELGHLSAAQRRALVISDNQLAISGAGWNLDLLRSELGLLQGDGFDLNLLGFEAPDLASLFNRGGGLTDPDAAPPLPAVPVSRAGDLWRLGRHRLLCGDATLAADVGRLLGAVRPHLMVTDPPYGVSYDADWRVRTGLGGAGSAVGRVTNDDRADWSAAWARFPGNVAYVWGGGLRSDQISAGLRASRFDLRAEICWVKTRPIVSRGAYHWQHELATYAVRAGEDDGWQRFEAEHEVAGYAVRSGATAHWEGGRKQSTVWFIEHLKSDTGHSTQKPVECMRRPIENNSRPGDAVYDPFVGSFTTGIAAEMTARDCFALEIDPGYCDVAALRWSAFVGAPPILEATGETFEAVAAARARKRRRVAA